MRVLLNGEGEPIPIQALPDELPISDQPPLAFLFEATETFPVDEYRDLGYTNFEVVCIGGAGGRGGGALTQLAWTLETTKQGVPTDIWNLVLERASLEDFMQQYFDANSSYNNNPNYYSQTAFEHQQYGMYPVGFMPAALLDRVYTGGDTTWSGAYPYTLPNDHTQPRWSNIASELRLAEKVSGFNDTWDFTYKQALEWVNPTHQLTFTTLKNVRLTGTPVELGGAGGGGGLHKAGGLLADLPDEIVVVVGGEGVDTEPGQTIQNGVITPDLTDPQFAGAGGPYYHYNPLSIPTSAAHYEKQRRIYEINNLLTDFTVTYPEPHPSFSNPQKGGDGGPSSFGDVCKASGGEGGDPSYGWPGGVKTFLGFGGDGGAGNSLVAGGGGAGSTASGVPGADGTWDGTIGKGGGGGLSGRASPIRASSPGGRGSYSFADPSRYGARQAKSGIIPGGGGGALLVPGPPAQYYGSDALGSNPKGGVYLRITKVE